MRAVRVPVAWRRMNELVGERHAGGEAPTYVVRCGLAPVPEPGADATLELARAALGQLTGRSAGWVAVAQDDGAPDRTLQRRAG